MIKSILVLLINISHNCLTPADCPQYNSITSAACPQISVTTARGTHAPIGQLCPGDLIFEENFNSLDEEKWSHENSLGGGGNWEFQWYTNNRNVSYTKDGNFIIKPRLLVDQKGEGFLTNGHLEIDSNECTNYDWFGCVRTGTEESILNPIISARVSTLYSFSFKYGRMEIRAKLPTGDWLWPAFWLLPRDNKYPPWPAGGEIDLMESRGNIDYTDFAGNQIGSQMVSSTLQWGPNWNRNQYLLTQVEKYNSAGFNTDYHTFQMEWTPEEISFSVDNELLDIFAPPDGGFWEWGGLKSTGLKNPWNTGSKMAPFDQEFYIIMNLAVGGTNGFFPDDGENANGPKPWCNNAPRASNSFWEKKNEWLPTWNQDTDNQTLVVDYVRVWAI